MKAVEHASTVFTPGLLEGRTALVTGGGTGLGRATAVELARCGARVLIAGRREDVLEEALGLILERTGAEAESISGDIRDRAGARQIIAAAIERTGRLDLLVNNAGGQFFSPAELIAPKGWRAVWRLNVEGMLNMSEAAVELAMGSAGGGTILNVTLSPHHGMPGMAHSGAARATVEALTRELARRWEPLGVVVTAVAAGHFNTEVMAKYPDSVRKGMHGAAPLQRMGTVEEHAWLVAMLASPVGSAFNGSTVTLDGGRDNWFGAWPPAGMEDESGEVPVEQRRAPGTMPH